MKKSSLRPSLAALFAMLLVLAACGSTESESQEAGQSSTEDQSDAEESMGDTDDMDSMDDMHDAEHGHEPLDVPDGMAVPGIEIEATVDPVSGHNLLVDLSDFELAPENASTDPVDGQGHLHLYIDGERKARFYNQALHLDGLEPGEHDVMVEVSANNHSAYAVDGNPIQAMTTITVAESGSSDGHGGHGSDHGDLVESANPPSIELTVVQDPKSGWNVFADVENLTFAPEAAGLDHVDGQGHLHLYVDGHKVARLYGSWWHIPALATGSHEITVEANANTHAPYDDGTGQVVAAVATIEVDEASGSTMAERADGEHAGDEHSDDEQADGEDGSHGHSHEGTGELLAIDAAEADVVVAAGFLDGSVEVEDRRVQVEEGQTVGITFESDTDEQVHVHGYDLLIDVGPGKIANLAFLADSPGTFEVELESSGRFLFEIQVR